MADHFALYVDRLVTSSTVDDILDRCCAPAPPPPPSPLCQSPPPGSFPASPAAAAEEAQLPVECPRDANCHVFLDVPPDAVAGSAESATCTWDGQQLTTRGAVECRICQEEDDAGNLEAPCACSGSLKFAHRKCVQRWCNEKGDTVCEICHQVYRSGYTAPTRPVSSDSIPIDISDTGGSRLDLHDPRIFAMAAERHFLEAEYGEYEAANASGAACCRSAALILMALLLLRHALSLTTAAGDEDASTFFTLFILRAAGFLLPCYIMARAMNMLQRRRHRQEAAMAAAEVAFLLQAGQARNMRIAVAELP